MAGRIGSYNFTVLKRLFRAFKEGLTIEKACEHAGIAMSTYFRWSNSKPYFRLKVERIMIGRDELVRDAMYASALKGDVQAQKAWMMNRSTWRFSESSINVTAQANASSEAKTEVTIDPEKARTRLQENVGILRRYGFIPETVSAN